MNHVEDVKQNVNKIKINKRYYQIYFRCLLILYKIDKSRIGYTLKAIEMEDEKEKNALI